QWHKTGGAEGLHTYQESWRDAGECVERVAGFSGHFDEVRQLSQSFFECGVAAVAVFGAGGAVCRAGYGIDPLREAVGEIYCGGVSVCAAGVAGDDESGAVAVAGGEPDRSNESAILGDDRESPVEAIFRAGVV